MRYLAVVDLGNVPAYSKFQSIADVINVISKVVAIGGGFMVLASFVYSAYLYISSGGDAKNIEKVKQMLTASLIGLAIVATAYWITQIVGKFLGQSI